MACPIGPSLQHGNDMTTPPDWPTPSYAAECRVTAPAQLAHRPNERSIQTCDVCSHPDVAHDVIARRYCAATTANALARTCICPLPDT